MLTIFVLFVNENKHKTDDITDPIIISGASVYVT